MYNDQYFFQSMLIFILLPLEKLTIFFLDIVYDESSLMLSTEAKRMMPPEFFVCVMHLYNRPSPRPPVLFKETDCEIVNYLEK